MKHKVLIKRKDNVRQHYWKSYGMAWDIEKAKKEGHTIKMLSPREYLSKTTEADHPTMYYDIETEKHEPISKLAEHIVSPEKKVTIPYVGDIPEEHEGRHRAIAAEVAGQKKIPVAVTLPKEDRDILAEAFIKEAFPESHITYQNEWRQRFKKGFPEASMDSKTLEKYKKVRKELNL